jgi:hypothetical protein
MAFFLLSDVRRVLSGWDVLEYTLPKTAGIFVHFFRMKI